MAQHVEEDRPLHACAVKHYDGETATLVVIAETGSSSSPVYGPELRIPPLDLLIITQNTAAGLEMVVAGDRLVALPTEEGACSSASIRGEEGAYNSSSRSSPS